MRALKKELFLANTLASTCDRQGSSSFLPLHVRTLPANKSGSAA